MTTSTKRLSEDAPLTPSSIRDRAGREDGSAGRVLLENLYSWMGKLKTQPLRTLPAKEIVGTLDALIDDAYPRRNYYPKAETGEQVPQ